MFSRATTPVRILVFIFALALATTGFAATKNFTVNLSSDVADATLADGACDTDPAPGDQGQCTLRAAIQQANNEAPAASQVHAITFSGVNQVTLAASLPNIIQRMSIDGSAGSGGRVVIDGAGLWECISANTLQGGSNGPVLPASNNSRFLNLVIQNCGGIGIALNGHGYTVNNCYIGVNSAGTAAAPNGGEGIDITASFDQGLVPDMSAAPIPPNSFANAAAIASYMASVASSIIPNVVTNCVISGNEGDGIEIHGTYSGNTIVFNNIIGLDKDRANAIPNGTAGGSAEFGVNITAAAWGNFIGMDNTIGGHDLDADGDGIHISTGQVPFPNFVLTNHVGVTPTNYSADFGNARSGINVSDARPVTTTSATYPSVNPLGLGAIIGPGNIVGYNGSDTCTPIQDNCFEGGILVSGGNSDGVRIWGNVVGMSTPAGGFTDIGNKGDGINIVGKNIEIGGDTLPEGNVIGSNNRHGIVVRGSASTTYNALVQANGIGTPNVVDIDAGNGGHGIWLLAGGNAIGGGTFANNKNVIAYNGLHGIKLETSSAFGNRIQQNEIYAVEPGFLPVDLDAVNNGADPTDNGTVTDRFGTAFGYTNWQQNTVTLSNASPAGVQWELRSAASGQYTIEFYASSAANAAKTFLCEVPALTVAGADPDDLGNMNKGYAAGTAGCAGATPGTYVTASVTDLKPTSGAEPDRPGSGGADVAILNTSEFSTSTQALDEVRFSSATYNVAENGGTVTISLQRSGTGAGAVSVNVVDPGTGTATAGTDYASFSPQVINWANGDTANKTFDITITNDNIDELNETIALELQNVSGGSLSSPSSATVTIIDDDATPFATVNDVSQLEGNAGTSNFTHTFTLSHPSSQTVSVLYSVEAGSATAGDFVPAVNQTITFLPGETSKDLNVVVNGDTTPEPNETYFVNLFTCTNCTVPPGDTFGVGTIQNDDGPLPQFSIADAGGAEGNAGPTPFTFTVSLPGPAASTYTVDVTTMDGDATTADGDYVAKIETLTFNPGDQTKNFVVTVNGDTKYEASEMMGATLSNATGGASILDAFADATIVNDDAIPSGFIDDVSVSEGNAATTPLVFTVTLSNASYQPISIDYALAPGGTATSGVDFTFAGGTLNFAPGEVSKTITVQVNGDTDDEPTETLAINLSNAVNAGLSDTQGTGTIINDDASTPTFTINSISQNEGNVGTTAFTFTVTLNPTSPSASVVTATAVNGTATTGDSDFVANSQVLNFPANTATQQFTVNVNGDPNFEPNETFTVTLSGQTLGLLVGSSGTGTILNDDVQPTLSIGDVTQTEGTGGTTNFGFVANLSHPTYTQVTLTYSTSDATAVAPGDYASATNVPVTFNAGETSKPVDISVVADAAPESSETFSVVLNNVNGATAPDNTAVGTIIDDDGGTPTFSVTNVSWVENNAGTAVFTFDVNLTPPSPTGATVTVATVDGTATAGSDYVANNQNLVFGNNEAMKQFVVTVNGDTTFESDETFSVVLSNASVGTQLGSNGTGTILNDDSVPVASIADVTQAEGNAGTTTFLFTVTLSNPSSQTVTVDYDTGSQTASPGSDYTATNGTLTFNPGEVSKQIAIDVMGETLFEANETFSLSIMNPVNATLGDDTAVGTITNDDTAPTISINDVAQAEGNAGTQQFAFTVTLSAAAGVAVTVDFATSDGTAIQPGDYAPNSGTLTFNPGITTLPVVVDVVGETTVESNETFTVTLSGGSNYTAAGSDLTGTGTINDDDGVPQPTFTVDNPTVTEGNAGTTVLTFTVTMAPTSLATQSVTATATNGTATIADGDFAAASTVLTFNPGVSTQQFTVNVNGDTKFETDETLTAVLSANSAGTAIGGSGTGTITNDDTQPSISVNDVANVEGNAGNTNIAFTASLSNASYQTVTVDYALSDGTANAPGDYAPGSNTITFNPGVTAMPIPFSIVGDTTPESNETVNVTLTNPVNATLGDAAGIGTINNDDGPAGPTFSVDSVTQAEGNAGATLYTFTVTISPTSASATSVTATATDGTATTADADFAAASTVLNFGAGVSTQTFNVTVNGDNKFENNETFTVVLSGNSGGTFLGANGTGTINNDDLQPTITIGDVSQSEGNGATIFSFTVTLSNPSAFPITVDWATANGTATAGSDFTGANGTLTFPPGTTVQTIAITILGDATNEPDETFTVALSNASGATIVDGTATGTIINNDAAANVAAIPALGARELALLSVLLAAVALIVMKRSV